MKKSTKPIRPNNVAEFTYLYFLFPKMEKVFMIKGILNTETKTI
jgi:hypothetical protein